MSFTPSSPDYILPKLKEQTLANIIKKGVRLSGRKLDQYRDIEIITDYIPHADGSAYVKLGNTQVLVGVKLELGTPYADTPNEGVMVVSAEFVPMASPSFEPGPPDENAIELARVIDRSLREIRAIDLEKLAIIPGKKVLIAWIDIYVLDHDGNLIDASSIATLAALLTTKMPKVEVTENEEVIIDKETRVGPLPLRHKVVTVTIGKLGDKLIVDPDLEEESVLSTRIVIAVSEDGRIAGMQKTGMGSLTQEEILRAIDIALAKGKELIALIEEKVKPKEEKPAEAEEKKAEEVKEEVKEEEKPVPEEKAEEPKEEKKKEEEEKKAEELEEKPQEAPEKEEREEAEEAVEEQAEEAVEEAPKPEEEEEQAEAQPEEKPAEPPEEKEREEEKKEPEQEEAAKEEPEEGRAEDEAEKAEEEKPEPEEETPSSEEVEEGAGEEEKSEEEGKEGGEESTKA